MLKIVWRIIGVLVVQWFGLGCVRGDVLCTPNDFGGFVADPNSCEKFFYCDQNGAATLVFCPEGMWFNPKKRICDLPSSVKCNAKNTTTAEEEYVLCPSRDSSFVTFVASKVNCRWYYMCYHGRPFKQECIPELFWNPKENRCDFPSKVRCSAQPPRPRCPTYGQDLFPHPSECDYFYFCINGFASLQQCPFYHHWDVETQSCQWKNRANCISNQAKSTNLSKSTKLNKANKPSQSISSPKTKKISTKKTKKRL